MTVGRVDGTTDVGIAEIVATVVIGVIGEETVEAIAVATGAADDLNGVHTADRIAGIIAGTHRSGVRNSFPKC